MVDLSDQVETEREEEARRLAREEARRPFDLTCGPLVRATLISLAHEDYVLLLSMHHVVSDGWSIGVLYRELSVLYEAFSKGNPSPLTDLSIQYADFGVWQREWLQGEVLESQLSYWRKQLAGVALLQLPTDRPRPAVQSYRGGRQSIELSKELTQGLKALSRKHGVTLYMTLLAAFQTLLHRYTGQDDLVVGSPIANRNRTEIESLIGFFVNTLVLRSNLAGNPTFRELLTRVREVALGAYAHQDIPFEKLVEALHPERNLSYSPLFQVMFVLQNAPATLPEFEGLTLRSFSVDSETAKFDLTLSMHEEAGGLRGSLQYSTDLFDEVTIDRMLIHFEVLLGGIVGDPEQRISEVPIVTQTEKHQLLVEWNDTKREFPKDKCIHELFEEQVEKSPDSVAIVFETEQLTYRELNLRANQVAHYLHKLGVGEDTLVGLYVERSLEMVVGLLGILKARGAYVPLDPAYPRERLAFILKDTQAPVLLTQERLIEVSRLKIEDGDPRSSIVNSRIRVVCLDTDWQDVADESQENPSKAATAENLAYVIYTSGSTGGPKGVLIEHRQILNYVKGIQDRYSLEPGASYSMLQPLSVDSSQTVIFPALISGGSLHVISEGKASDPQALGEYFHRSPVDLLKIAPSHLHALQTSPQFEQILPRRWLIIGGETSRREWVEKLQTMACCSIFNHYGPTEATVGVLTYQVQIDQENHDSPTVPIGSPLPNTRAYLLDRHLQPVVIGVSGELYIGGSSLARGYLNRAQLTAEKFIPDPFSDEPGARLYKTGDLARYLPDGNIEFLGRTDDQVKIRGFRIETGEIEAALADHPSVGQSMVLVREDEPNDKRLVAYVVSKQEPLPTTTELRSFLRKKLPEYMVPSAFILLNTLPRTPHGKLDRNALPAPDQSRPLLEESYVALRTPVEELLAQIWADLLKVEKVGLHDNFFDLGGHSLLATQLISRVRDTFRLEFALRSLFEAPTVARLAKHIESVRQRATGARALPIVPEQINGDCPLSFSQERFWFLSQLEPNNLAYQVTFGFHLTGPLNVKALEQSLTEIVRRHETLRTTFHQRNGGLVQVISQQWVFQISILDLRQQTAAVLDAEVERIFDKERRRPFDLSADLLLRATLLRLDNSEHVLILARHHMAWDHWCIEIFFRELSVLYQAYAIGRASSLPELPIQYKHYALWQRKMFHRAELENHLTYWKEQLRDAPPTLNLPTDHPRKPLHNRRRGGRQTVHLPTRLADDLKALSRRGGTTFFMTLLAAFQTLLHRISGQDDIVVGTPVAGRDRSETEGLIGLFLNTLVLRTNLCGNPTFFQLLRRVRDVALGAYDHQDLPFEKLVEELKPARDLTQTPIFQVFINSYNFKETGLDLDGLAVERLTDTEPAPQFDIEFYIREHDDGLVLTFVYDSDLFEFETITRILGHFQVLLEGILSDPRQRISDLPLLTKTEKHQLLMKWNDTKRDYPPDKCIQQLFEQQVERTPEAAAVVFEDQQLTYRELNNRANQLAHYLQKLSVGPEVLVGICVERSMEMVVGLLGILKAGGAYVPLDPSYPEERLAFMLEDSRGPVLITQSSLIERLPTHNATVLCLDRDWGEISSESQDNPLPLTTPDNLAYVIYTSGSTGIPKGALIAHHNVVRLFRATGSWFHFGSDDVWTLFHSYAFDFSVWELWGALLHGGRLVIVPFEVSQSPQEFYQLLCREQVTVLNQTPSAFRQLLGAEESVIDPSQIQLRLVIFGGEALDFQNLKPWFNRHGDQRPQLINMYGITETTVHVTYQIIKETDLHPGVPSLIGVPIPDLELYVLDLYRNLVPVGVPGELYIGGAGLARGYLNRAELTAERFVGHPFDDGKGRRLYRSGDLVRRRANGDIEYLGRIDHQVKIRGFRVELGEVEAMLAQHPAVQQTVVVAREDSLGHKRLVAYVVSAQGLRAYND